MAAGTKPGSAVMVGVMAEYRGELSNSGDNAAATIYSALTTGLVHPFEADLPEALPLARAGVILFGEAANSYTLGSPDVG